MNHSDAACILKPCRPITIDTPRATLDAIQYRVADFPWHEMPDDGGWVYGSNLDYMTELAEYGITSFDWRKQQMAINQFPQFITDVDGIDIHFIHEMGSGPCPTPLIISQGRAILLSSS